MTVEKFVLGYILYFVAIMMMRYSLIQAEADYSQNPAWVLINFLSIAMGSILVIAAVCVFVFQHQSESQKAADRKKHKEAMRLENEKAAEQRRVYAIEYAKNQQIEVEKNRQNEIRKQLEQQEEEARVAREFVRRKNRAAIQVCEEALSELL